MKKTEMKKTDLEKKAEEQLIRAVAALDCHAYKMLWPGETGAPDRMIVGYGLTWFVEAKRPKGGKLSARQRVVHRDLKKYGHTVYIVHNDDSLSIFLNKMKDEIRAKGLSDIC